VFSRFLVGAMSYAARIRISLSIFTPKALSMRSAMIALDLRPKMSDNKGVTSQLIFHLIRTFSGRVANGIGLLAFSKGPSHLEVRSAPLEPSKQSVPAVS